MFLTAEFPPWFSVKRYTIRNRNGGLIARLCHEYVEHYVGKLKAGERCKISVKLGKPKKVYG